MVNTKEMVNQLQTEVAASRRRHVMCSCSGSVVMGDNILMHTVHTNITLFSLVLLGTFEAKNRNFRWLIGFVDAEIFDVKVSIFQCLS